MPFKSKVTIVTPATTFDLTDLLKVRAALVIDDATPAQNVWLRTAIRQCSLAVAIECNRIFPMQSYSETFYAVGCASSEVLQLSRWPIIELSTVTVNGTALVEDTDFIADTETGQLTRLCGGMPGWWSGVSTVVEYDAGYDPIPADLSDIVHGLIQGQWLASSGERDPFLRSEDIPGVASYTYATLATQAGAGFAAAANGRIASYKQPAFA